MAAQEEEAKEERSNSSTTQSPGIGGDPHIITWKDEHYDFHGQCDLVLLSDPNFTRSVGVDIHIRTKVVRYWSFTESVAIRLGKDTLEIQGTTSNDGTNNGEPNYWINGKHKGDLFLLGGYPIFQKRPQGHTLTYQINLSPTYPNAEIVVQVYKQFVRVKINGDDEAFGRSVGLLGDYLTGEILARDGMTVLRQQDNKAIGDEWQVLPSEGPLFHEDQAPQFPVRCLQPKSPSKQHERWLAESSISVSEAEAACAKVGDLPSIKDCVHDVLATQDLGMRGAF
ncbi:unnamed protein product [Cylindrotheca closterium]|uniref:VWFD domain-containing protein n=1 Tax=Cylindrotheca closterium TaxID=2856 RepID=A0AAD2PY49_9STRA|nr:unnamed protein product [Cylindrotheca closterium]